MRSINILQTLILALFLGACARNEEARIYKPGNEYLFKIYRTKDTICCIKLDILDNNSFINKLIGQYNIEWTYPSGKAATTLFNDNEDRVSLHSPRKDFMSFTEILPFPKISLPPHIGNYFQTRREVVSGFGELDGKTIKLRSEVTAQDTIEIMQAERPVWVIEGRNTNLIEEFGQYEVPYYFHETLGFVRWVYRKPDGEEVIMELVKVEEGKKVE